MMPAVSGRPGSPGESPAPRPNRRHAVFFLLWALILTCLLSAPAWSGQDIPVGLFSQARPGGPFPEGWMPLTFDGIQSHTDYRLVDDDGQTVVRAHSRKAASGMIRRLTIDPAAYPLVSWQWKVENILVKGDVTTKQGDDYPARLYITFAYTPEKMGFFDKIKYEAFKALHGRYPPHAAINYIWASNAPVGTRVFNAYTDRTCMFVLESGDGQAGRWVAEHRNVLEDYREAFGESPPPISAVAIMTDTDNTGESAVAYYGDIYFGSTRTPR